MTVNEKRGYIADYCEVTACINCVLRDKAWKTTFPNNDCLFIGKASEDELDRAIKLIKGSSTGGNNMENEKVTISLERYDELIKKEVLYDELTKGKKTSMYLYQEVDETLEEGNNNGK